MKRPRSFLAIGFIGLVGVMLLSGCDLFFKATPPYSNHLQVQQIEVTLKEWQVIPANISAKAGTVRFVVQNAGTMSHGFEVESESSSIKFDEEIEPFPANQTRTLEVTLAPGQYEIYCQVPGHKALGMKGTLTVTK